MQQLKSDFKSISKTYNDEKIRKPATTSLLGEPRH